MHATIEQLLSLRDSEPVSADVKRHVSVCMLCHKQLEELTLVKDELNRLPAHTSHHHNWPEILTRVDQVREDSNRRHRMLQYGGIAAAASVLLAILVYSVLPGVVSGPKSAESSQLISDNTIGDEISETGLKMEDPVLEQPETSEPDLDQLIAQSAYLEAILDTLPRRPRVMRASTTDLITGLTDTVALIDYRLNTEHDLSDTRARNLWRQRVDLMNSLVYVRAAEAQQVAYIPN